ncbi:hypothetical protein [Geitlerinema calcuttense]|uniref:Uncharacterized protein n=1 Tax=Geitlerinema calcuttense NRMC-F 0142 TaxID=2922238 RepID=A0ABT7LW01_9CYAN|nr:hypothetical protein [Geitlerinema calcuttense]MDL5056196.1 hypothetical protein [Geitlerinema calcuttense NRMC-F 0142]
MAEKHLVSLIMLIDCVRDECGAVVLLLPGDLASTLRSQISRGNDGLSRTYSSYSAWKKTSKALFSWRPPGSFSSDRSAQERLRSEAASIFQAQTEKLHVEGWQIQTTDQDRGWRITVFERSGTVIP